jgi:hypothetical protein
LEAAVEESIVHRATIRKRHDAKDPFPAVASSVVRDGGPVSHAAVSLHLAPKWLARTATHHSRRRWGRLRNTCSSK